MPVLLVASEIDPVITPRAIEPYLPAHAAVGRMPADLARAPRRAAVDGRPASFTLLWHPDAGHVGFPGRLALESRLFGWLGGTARACSGTPGSAPSEAPAGKTGNLVVPPARPGIR